MNQAVTPSPPILGSGAAGDERPEVIDETDPQVKEKLEAMVEELKVGIRAWEMHGDAWKCRYVPYGHKKVDVLGRCCMMLDVSDVIGLKGFGGTESILENKVKQMDMQQFWRSTIHSFEGF